MERLPGSGSWLVQIDDERRPVDEDGEPADGEAAGEKLDDLVASCPLGGGYPTEVDRELPKLEPLGEDEPGEDELGEDEVAEGESATVAVADEDGVLHTESAGPEESFAE